MCSTRSEVSGGSKRCAERDGLNVQPKRGRGGCNVTVARILPLVRLPRSSWCPVREAQGSGWDAPGVCPVVGSSLALVADTAKGRPGAMIQTRSVKDLMNADIMTIADDMTTDEAARYLIEHEISGAPVVDEQGHLVGMLSMTDIGRSVAEPSEVGSSAGSGFYRDDGAEVALDDARQRSVQEPAVTVRDVMTPAVHQVDSDRVCGRGGTSHGGAARPPAGGDQGQGARGHCHEHGSVEVDGRLEPGQGHAPCCLPGHGLCHTTRGDGSHVTARQARRRRSSGGWT